MGNSNAEKAMRERIRHERSEYCKVCASEYMIMAREMRLNIIYIIACLESGENIDIQDALQKTLDGKNIKNNRISGLYSFKPIYKNIIDGNIKAENERHRNGKIAV